MWNPPTKADLAELPGLKETENVPLGDKIIHMHFFIGASDWWAIEYGERAYADKSITRKFFGFVRLNGDDEMSEWGYFDLDEMLEIKVCGVEIDRDLHWRPRPAREIEAIKIYDEV